MRASRSYIALKRRVRVSTRHTEAGGQAARPASSQPSSRPDHYDCQANANGLCIINGPRATTGRGSHGRVYIRRRRDSQAVPRRVFSFS